MAIKHIVFFRVPEGSEASADELASRLRGMEGVVPMLQSIEVGVDFNRM